MSAGMMIGANDLSVLMHMKSKSPAIGKDTSISSPVEIGCPSLSRHDSKTIAAIQQQLGIKSKSTVYRLLRLDGINPSRR